jgi:hypothetical protein
MNHAILIAALAEDQWRRCRCGTVAQQHYGLCRECQAVAAWRGKIALTSRGGTTNWTGAETAKTRLFARVASLLQIIIRGAGS